MLLKENFSLLRLNTFGIDAYCRLFIEYSDISELKDALKKVKEMHIPMLHIGGGSNLLFTKDFEGVVLHAGSKNIKIIKETEDNIYIEADAGVVWDEFVEWTIKHGSFGLENLSLIPGEVGASAVQNIGAYGIEVCQYIDRVKTLEVATEKYHEFKNEECNYGYRHSIFKGELYGKHIVTSVVYKLSKVFTPHLEYGALKTQLEKHNLNAKDITAQQLRNQIIDIRNEKLPNPNDIGSAGSFFMNPIVSEEKFVALYQQYPTIPHYPAKNGIKLSAGWLIDQAGWKGKKFKNAGVYEKQALVLVNNGGATGDDVVQLAQSIQKDILEKFGINIKPEAIYI